MYPWILALNCARRLYNCNSFYFLNSKNSLAIFLGEHYSVHLVGTIFSLAEDQLSNCQNSLLKLFTISVGIPISNRKHFPTYLFRVSTSADILPHTLCVLKTFFFNFKFIKGNNCNSENFWTKNLCNITQVYVM